MEHFLIPPHETPRCYAARNAFLLRRVKRLARYSTNESLINCLKALWEESKKKKVCPKALKSRGSAAAAGGGGAEAGAGVSGGAKGFFTPDGVNCGHVFVVEAGESAAGIVAGLGHLQVSCYTRKYEYLSRSDFSFLVSVCVLPCSLACFLFFF